MIAPDSVNIKIHYAIKNDQLEKDFQRMHTNLSAALNAKEALAESLSNEIVILNISLRFAIHRADSLWTERNFFATELTVCKAHLETLRGKR